MTQRFVGVLPFSYVHNSVVFLLCEDASSKLWSCFGNNQPVANKELAAYTCFQQSLGLLSKQNRIQNALSDKCKIESTRNEDVIYFMYIKFEKTLPDHFKEVYRYCLQAFENKMPKPGYFTKTNILWLPAPELYNNIIQKQTIDKIVLSIDLKQLFKQLIIHFKLRKPKFQEHFIKMKYVLYKH